MFYIMNKIFDVDDLRREISSYLEFDDLLTLQKICNNNFLTFFYFSPKNDTIFDTIEMKISNKYYSCDMWKKDDNTIFLSIQKILEKEYNEYIRKCMHNCEGNKRMVLSSSTLIYTKKGNLLDWIKKNTPYIHARKTIELIESFGKEGLLKGKKIIDDINEIDKYCDINDIRKRLLIDVESYYLKSLRENIDISKFCTRCATFGHMNNSIECIIDIDIDRKFKEDAKHTCDENLEKLKSHKKFKLFESKESLENFTEFEKIDTVKTLDNVYLYKDIDKYYEKQRTILDNEFKNSLHETIDYKFDIDIFNRDFPLFSAKAYEQMMKKESRSENYVSWNKGIIKVSRYDSDDLSIFSHYHY
jgi:hypothetical protein